MRIEQSVSVSRPIDEVFALVGNPDNDPQWGSLIVESQQVSPGSIRIGTAFRQMATFLGGRLETMIEITAYEPGSKVCYRTAEPVPIEHCRVFGETPEGTRLTFITVVEPAGKFRLPTVMLERIAKRQMEADLDGIKTMIEGATP